jgi:hypothetical protein
VGACDWFCVCFVFIIWCARVRDFRKKMIRGNSPSQVDSPAVHFYPFALDLSYPSVPVFASFAAYARVAAGRW